MTRLTNGTSAILLCLFLLISFSSNAQSNDYIDIVESVDASGNYLYTFSPDLAELNQDYPLDSTDPDATYTFFWSFGDGNYSFENEPSHSYKSSGSMNIQMIATPRYSPTLPPPPDDEVLAAKSGLTPPVNTDPMLLLDREPRPGYASLGIINYENITSTTVSNCELRFYFRKEYFTYLDFHKFNNESYIGYVQDPSLMPEYDGYVAYDVGTLAPGEQNTLMVQIETLLEAMGPIGQPLPELHLLAQLLTITNSKLGMTTTIIQEQDLVTEACGSWDPNDKVAITDDIFYDLMPQSQWIEYKINFQNMGIAPAKNIVIFDTILPDFDSTEFKIIDYHHPNIAIHNGFSYKYNSTNRTLRVFFTNINLSGLNQSGITDPNLTQGHVSFAVKTKNKTLFAPSNFTSVDSCKPYYQFSNTAYIKFDNNPAIKTNVASTDLYLSSLATCFNPIDSCSLQMRLIPNPITNGKIIIQVCNQCRTTFALNSSTVINYKLYTSAFVPVNCALNVSYGSGSTASSVSSTSSANCKQIIMQPTCLTSGTYYLVVQYNGNLYRFTIIN